MKTSEIKELIQVLQNTDYRYIFIKQEDTSILLSKDAVNEVQEIQAPPVIKPVKAEKCEESIAPVKENVQLPAQQIQEPVKEDDCFIVKSPIVGTYYGSPSPDAESFVKRGDVINKGDIICIIEAMKLMNEIESEVSGEVIEILVENEAIVQYGQPLFKIKTNG